MLEYDFYLSKLHLLIKNNEQLSLFKIYFQLNTCSDKKENSRLCRSLIKGQS